MIKRMYYVETTVRVHFNSCIKQLGVNNQTGMNQRWSKSWDVRGIIGLKSSYFDQGQRLWDTGPMNVAVELLLYLGPRSKRRFGEGA